jgi:3-methyladenine DNA glycosylase Mpg
MTFLSASSKTAPVVVLICIPVKKIYVFTLYGLSVSFNVSCSVIKKICKTVLFMQSNAEFMLAIASLEETV